MGQPLTDELIFSTLILVLLVVAFFIGAYIFAVHVKKKHDREKAEWGIGDGEDSNPNATLTKMGLYSAYGGSMRGMSGMAKR